MSGVGVDETFVDLDKRCVLFACKGKGAATLGEFHLVKMLSQAVDDTRRQEAGKGARFKEIRFLFLKNPARLSAAERDKLHDVLGEYAFAKTAEAYRLRLAFQELLHQTKDNAAGFLALWLEAAYDSGVSTPVNFGARSPAKREPLRRSREDQNCTLFWRDLNLENGGRCWT